MGLATAKRFVQEGVDHVFITGRRKDALDAAVAEIEKNVTAVQGDVASLADLDRLYDAVKKRDGKLDIIFANAGLAKLAPFGNVDGVVEGAVLRSGERVRITAQLIRVNPEKHLWAESYQRDLRDVLVLQEDIAHDIAREIRIKLTPQDKARLSSVRAVNPEAQQAYLRGIYHWNKRSPEALKAAIAHFKEAIRVDPNFTEAYAGLADSYSSLCLIADAPPKEYFPQAREAALKALQLEDGSAEAHTALAYVKLCLIGIGRERRRSSNAPRT